MKHSVVIFGGSGFIGSHLIERLCADQGVAVISVDRCRPAKRFEGVTYIDGDVRDLSRLDIQHPISKIYNFAAVHTTPGHPVHEYYDTNVTGAVEICAFARRHNVNEIVFTSSISVYGPSEEPKTEESIPDPQTAYGWSKLLAERIHRAWAAEANERRLVVVRPAVVFGANEGGNFTRLAKMLKLGFFVFPGRTDTIKSCIYVEDLLDAISFAQAQAEKYVLFNGAYPERYTISEIVDIFKTEHFPKARTFVFPKPLLLLAAALLSPFAKAGIGIHPERILKLVRSTNILPGWLEKRGQAKKLGLTSALQHWSDTTKGKFS